MLQLNSVDNNSVNIKKWYLIFFIYYAKSANFHFISGRSGIHSHVLQYMQKVHTHGVNIRYISEVHYKMWMIERLLNKANASLFSICLHNALRLDRSSLADILLLFNVSERGRLFSHQLALNDAKLRKKIEICKFICKIRARK